MKTAKLGDLVKITIGRTPSRGNPDFWDREKKTENVWLSIADMLKVDGREVFDSKEYVTDKAVNAFAIVPKGTLLVSFKLTLGRLVFAGKDLRTNEAIAALHNDESKITNEYLYHYLSKFDWADYASADQKVKGLTLNKEKLGNMPIEYPESKDEQRKIVRKLDDALGRLSRAEKLLKENIENVSLLQKSILAEAFDIDSADTHTHRLGDFVKIKHGKDWKGLKSGTIPVYGSGGFMGKYVDTYSYNRPTVLLPRKGTITNIFYLDKPFWNVDTVFYTEIDTTKLEPRYLYYHMKTVDLEALDSGSGRPSLTQTILYEAPIIVPSLPDQQKIVQKLDKLFAETKKLTDLNTTKLQNLANLRQSVLAEAFQVG